MCLVHWVLGQNDCIHMKQYFLGVICVEGISVRFVARSLNSPDTGSCDFSAMSIADEPEQQLSVFPVTTSCVPVPRYSSVQIIQLCTYSSLYVIRCLLAKILPGSNGGRACASCRVRSADAAPNPPAERTQKLQSIKNLRRDGVTSARNFPWMTSPSVL